SRSEEVARCAEEAGILGVQKSEAAESGGLHLSKHASRATIHASDRRPSSRGLRARGRYSARSGRRANRRDALRRGPRADPRRLWWWASTPGRRRRCLPKRLPPRRRARRHPEPRRAKFCAVISFIASDRCLTTRHTSSCDKTQTAGGGDSSERNKV